MSRTDKAERLILTPVARVFSALMDPEQLVQWLPPNDMTGTIAEFDPREGGAFRITLRYSKPGQGKSTSDSDVIEAKFGAIVRDRLVEWLVTFASPDAAFAGEMRMEWHLVERAGATLVSIVARNVPKGISASDHADGLNASLHNLERFLAA